MASRPRTRARPAPPDRSRRRGGASSSARAPPSARPSSCPLHRAPRVSRERAKGVGPAGMPIAQGVPLACGGRFSTGRIVGARVRGPTGGLRPRSQRPRSRRTCSGVRAAGLLRRRHPDRVATEHSPTFGAGISGNRGHLPNRLCIRPGTAEVTQRSRRKQRTRRTPCSPPRPPLPLRTLRDFRRSSDAHDDSGFGIRCSRPRDPSTASRGGRRKKGGCLVLCCDAGRKVTGRKRFLGVDTQGFLLEALILEASLSESRGAERTLPHLKRSILS